MWGTASQFLMLVRELSLDALADQAERAPRVLIVGDVSAGRVVARLLFGADYDLHVIVSDTIPADDTSGFDLVLLLWTGGVSTALRERVVAVRHHGWPLLLLSNAQQPAPAGLVPIGEMLTLPPDEPAALEATRLQLVTFVDESRRLALGRHLPAMRPAVAANLVNDTCQVNAQFAGISGLTSILPVIGNLLAVGADFLVLTKNQLVMIFKLAAIYGRDLEDRQRIYLEMAPVVGAALAWRTVAREMIGLLPGPFGIVPRVAIAYTGTYAVGRSAQYYYQEGKAPTRAQMRSYYRQAARWFQRIRHRLVPGAKPAPASNGTITVQELPMAPSSRPPMP